MRRFALFIILLTPSLTTHALDTRQTPPEQLLELGGQLAAHAGSSQWQQLWQRTRAAGHLKAKPGHPYFTIPQPQLPDLARQTLAHADHVEALDITLARYRRTFPDRVIGMLDDQPLNSICLVIDWRTLPEAHAKKSVAYLKGTSLLNSYPCQ
ncbi:hypothetical protein [Pseudomonas sp. NBRC 111124]|uniref:hypothetical protein n=1 Tax=Pseudomonas sp. NBRC 111124 TaxID=1661039 RepID=UPI000761177E|nr:hypothetical protein [Pseudomonas sp. NBRC 111124]